MLKVLAGWLLNAISLLVVANVVRGFEVTSLAAALIAALVIGLVNATLGLVLKIITFPLTVVTLGVFWFVINALMLELASAIVPGFRVYSFWSAFFGAIILSALNMFLKLLLWTATA